MIRRMIHGLEHQVTEEKTQVERRIAVDDHQSILDAALRIIALIAGLRACILRTCRGSDGNRRRTTGAQPLASARGSDRHGKGSAARA